MLWMQDLRQELSFHMFALSPRTQADALVAVPCDCDPVVASDQLARSLDSKTCYSALPAAPIGHSHSIGAIPRTTRMREMKLQDLKSKTPGELVSFAEELEVENASTMRKQELMFGILKQLA